MLLYTQMQPNDFQVIILITLVIVTAASVTRFNIDGSRLFAYLEEYCPKYYTENGRPEYYADPIRNFHAQEYLFLLVTTGMPNDAPKDVGARRHISNAIRSGRQTYTIVSALALSGIVYAIWFN